MHWASHKWRLSPIVEFHQFTIIAGQQCKDSNETPRILPIRRSLEGLDLFRTLWAWIWTRFESDGPAFGFVSNSSSQSLDSFRTLSDGVRVSDLFRTP
eukprot:scaffold183449_cov18-Prasinocladus_malaysianus.AAC.5